MPKFTTYRTYYDLYCEAAPKGKKKTYKEYYTDALKLLAQAIIDPNSVKTLYPDPEVYRLALEAREDWPLSLTTHEAEYEWYYTSRPTFKVFPSMVDALAHTSIDVECEHVHLPFPSFRHSSSDTYTQGVSARSRPDFEDIETLRSGVELSPDGVRLG